MRILFVLEYFHPHIGGLETLFKGLTDHLSNQGHQITIITNRYSPDLSKSEYLGNTRVFRYPFRNRYLFTFLAFFPTLRHVFRHDLIHTTSYNAGLPAWIAGKLSGRKVIITFHEAWGDLWLKLPFFPRWKLRAMQLFEKLLLRLPYHRFIAVSRSTAQSLIRQGVESKRVVTIHNGIDYGVLTPPGHKVSDKPDAGFKFIYFGRLGISKGLDILLPAVHLLAQECIDFKLELVIPKEPSALFEKIQKIITNLSIEKNLHLHHDLGQKELFQLVRSCDAVVIPSYSEGFCFTAVESMALNVPIVSSHQGALQEVVSGKYIAYHDQEPEALKQALLQAISGDWEFKKMLHFPLEKSLEKYLALYREIAQE